MNERKLELIRQDIDRAKSLLSSKNREEQYKFIKKAVDAWSNKKCDISKGLMELKKYQQDNIEFNFSFGDVRDVNDYNWDEDLSQLIRNLEILEEELRSERQQKPTARKVPNQDPKVIVNTYVNVHITLSQTIQALHKTSLSKNELAEITQMLAELEESKGKQKNTVWGKAKKILAWLGDKAVDVGIAVLPYIMAAIA
jgi:MinD-like ATPase involved in chromosome partitioning or flagellar assembly